MPFVDTIYMSWRKARGDIRLLIGILKRTDNGFSFQYDQSELTKAKKEGFLNYPEFDDTTKVYSEYLPEAFSIRLMPQARPERRKFLDFWLVPAGVDWFDELAFTQGKLTSDNFEFLGLFQPGTVNNFVTDIAGLSYKNIPFDKLAENDLLAYDIKEFEGAFRKKAVELFFKGEHLGYVKQVHNAFFISASNKVRTLRVKQVLKNGIIKECFVEVRL